LPVPAVPVAVAEPPAVPDAPGAPGAEVGTVPAVKKWEVMQPWTQAANFSVSDGLPEP
jgi:hypothetical protein